MTRRQLVGATLAGSLVILGLGVRFGPALAFSWALAFPPETPKMGGLQADSVREEVSLPVSGRVLSADLYRPTRPRGALLIVHGLSRAGGRHPELVRLARLLAERGQLVLVPTFEGLAAFRLSGREVDEVATALRYLAGRGGRVGIAGFSFGAGPALLAAAGVPNLRVVGSFGGYADLRHIIRYITTGVHAFGGRRYVHRQEEYNRWKLLALLVGFVESDQDRARLAAIADRKLANPTENVDTLAAALGDEGQRILALALSRDEGAVDRLLERLPSRARETLDVLSPLRIMPGFSGRLLLAHGTEDDSIPFTESLRLAEAAGGRARVVLLRTFHHTGPAPLWDSLGQRALDGWNLFRLVDALLAA